jgi:hypothetical protein
MARLSLNRPLAQQQRIEGKGAWGGGVRATESDTASNGSRQAGVPQLPPHGYIPQLAASHRFSSQAQTAAVYLIGENERQLKRNRSG